MSSSSAAPPVVASEPGVDSRFALPELPTVEGIDTAKNPLNAFRLCAAKQVADAWGEENIKKVFDGVDFGKKNVDLALALPRFYKKDPEQWAQKVLDSFQPNNAIASVDFVKPFLQFTINKPAFTYHTLRAINVAARAAAANPTSHTQAFGTEDEAHGKHMLIDFSSPNIAKPFHAGHLRSTIIGAVLSNLHEAFGWKVTRLNYLGDWGTQYGMLSIGFDRYGNEEALVADPIKHLYEVGQYLFYEGFWLKTKVYVKVNKDKADEEARIAAGEEIDPETTTHAQAKKVFRAMEDGEATALAQWSRFREFSIEALKRTYEKLNIHFDVYWGESQVAKESMERAIQVLQDKGLITEDRGALLVDLKKYKLEKGLVKKADGTSIYLTRDLGGAYDKWLKYKFDKHIYVVQAAQSFHFKQLFKTLELMEEEFAGRFEHVSFGMVNGMSTRKGTVVFLEDILEEATTTMHEQMRSNENKYAQIEEPEKTSAIIGDAAVKIQDFSGKRVNDYAFDMKRCTSFEGDFGPFIQYSHVRLCSVQRKNPNVPVPASVDEIDISVLDDPKVHDIIYQLSLYPQFLRNAYTANEPSTLVTWCFKLSHLVGSAWETVKVSGAPEEAAKARLFLYICTRDVLAEAMKLLSLVPIERM